MTGVYRRLLYGLHCYEYKKILTMIRNLSAICPVFTSTNAKDIGGENLSATAIRLSLPRTQNYTARMNVVYKLSGEENLSATASRLPRTQIFARGLLLLVI